MSSSKALTVKQQTQIAKSDGNWTQEQIELVKRMYCKDASDDEFKVFVSIAQRAGLDPTLKQIHAVKRWNSQAGRNEMQIQVGIDGFRLIAMRSGAYAGSDDPVFTGTGRPPEAATVTVYKIVQGVRCPFTATARWEEYFPGEKMGFMWKAKPFLMLSKCAEALALRKAFPGDLSGLYVEEEMAQADAHAEEYAKSHAVGANVRPEQPPEDGSDGLTDVGDYRIGGGTYARRGLHEVEAKTMLDYISRREQTLKARKKEPEGWFIELCQRAQEFYAAQENGTWEDDV